MMVRFATAGRLLDPRGRLSRSHYGRRLIRTLLAFVAVACLAILAASMEFRAAALVLLGLDVVVAASVVTMATARRLHDRDRTAWWLLPNLVATLAGFAPLEIWVDAYPVPVTVATLAMTGFSLWFLIETLGRRGSPGPNRFGPAPPR